jgi:hypothetical protein
MLTSLIPNPLHPAIVHLPMALVVLLPVTVLIALWVIRRGGHPTKVWGAAAGLHAALVLSAWASLQTGEQADEQVERVVAEAPIGTHEEAAEAFMVLAAGTLVISLVGLLKNRPGQLARGATAVSAVALLVSGWNVGHSGGELVYRYNAGAAYTDSTAVRTASVRAAEDDH